MLTPCNRSSICFKQGVREISPSWSKHELWQEAFVTSKNILSQIRSKKQLLVCHDLVLSITCCRIIYCIPITGSLRLIQHVESVQGPLLWEDVQSKTWSDVSWAVKQFQVWHTYFHIYLFIFVILLYPANNIFKIQN